MNSNGQKRFPTGNGVRAAQERQEGIQAWEKITRSREGDQYVWIIQTTLGSDEGRME